jgi:hypothetical protein
MNALRVFIKMSLLYFARTERDGVSHATIIVAVEDGKIFYAAHTSNQDKKDLADSIGKYAYVLIVRLND